MNDFKANKFRKKPIVIEAVQWKGTPNNVQTSVVEIYNFLEGKDAKGAGSCKTEGDNFRYDYSGSRPELLIKTLEGDMIARRGDWIIKGVNGEFYPCKPEIFEKTYESVTS